jgi:NTE family protein
MIPAATSALFFVVFGAASIAFVVLVVLTLRFTWGRMTASRDSWLDSRHGQPEDGADGEGSEGGPDEEDEDEGLTALVLAGGSTRGAVQIGMLQVLAEHGFVPDRIYGASVGAINGVAFASDPTVAGIEHMTRIWKGIRRQTIYPQGRLHGPWLYLQQRDAVYSNLGLRTVIEEGLAHERLEETAIPVEVVATSLTDGGERWFTSGPAVDAVLASTAMPAIYPPVEIDGERFIDGGVVDNVPLQRAIDAGATRIVVLLCGPPVFTPPRSKRPVEGMVNALVIAIHARFVRDMAHLPEGVEVILCVGPEDATRDFDDFSTTEELIAKGRAEASEVVRRYGLGTIAHPGMPRPVPADPPPGGPDEPADGADPEPTPGPAAAAGPGPDSAPGDQSDPVAAGPSTQPVPGT